jgi:hypothetical protein
MSFSERAILWLHIGVAIFTIGPVTAAIMSTPRYIRKRNAVVTGYLYRMTRLYTIASLLLLVFGIILAEELHELSKPWLSVSMTLYVVALVLLVLILRDQRRAVAALGEAMAPGPAPLAQGTAAAPGAAPGAVTVPVPETAGVPAGAPDGPDGDGALPAATAAPEADTDADTDADAEKIAAVERGRIASLAGVTGLIWLVILVLMIWR